MSIAEASLTIEQLTDDIRRDEVACACGCGELRPRIGAKGRLCRFVRGHNARIQNPGRGRGDCNVEQRFWAKVDFRGDCWEWTAAKTEGGYGTFTPHRRAKRGCAHRFAYEILVSPIPDGMELDHRCRNRRCVNPDHLEVVTAAENTRRSYGPTGRNSRKTHCIRGHEFSEANTRIETNGRRACRACCAERRRARDARLRSRRLLGVAA